METFWVLTYLDVNDRVGTDRFSNEQDATSAWYIANRPMFLDEVTRLKFNI
jgi:hypothetical protein